MIIRQSQYNLQNVPGVGIIEQLQGFTRLAQAQHRLSGFEMHTYSIKRSPLVDLT